MKLINFLFVVLLVISITGCATQYVQTKIRPEPRPLGEKIRAFHAPYHLSEISTQTSEFKEPAGNITLNQALSLALIQNPELASFSWEIRAMEARSLQAGLLPNPELDLEAENLEGTGEFQGTKVMETTIRLSQLIELGGKRIKRTRVADLNRNLAGWDYETKRLDVLTEVTISFINVLASQERLVLTGEIVELAEQVHHTVSERVKAGKVSPVEETKAKVALSTSQIELERAKRELEAAKKILAAAWGSTSPVFKKVEGEFDTISPIPSIKQLTDLINKNPDIARWAMEMEKQRAEVEYAKAGSIPDLTVSGGFRRFNETDDNSFVLGISIPLQFFNRNQGELFEARYRLAKAKEEQRAAELRIRASLAEAYQALSTGFLEANAWKNQVLPGAQSAFEAVREGYRYGKFGLLDVLDAQRTFFEAKSRYRETLAEYHKGAAEVERLIGTSLREIKN